MRMSSTFTARLTWFGSWCAASSRALAAVGEPGVVKRDFNLICLAMTLDFVHVF